ncbi:hypothetical protein ACH4OY_31640 [Micromonospora rubida]|uniref:Uncharacterized protein n=1 Tax=Micromonospora rubida TaxID=2697657 RepID=A0ABW7STZ1_9ACTN
MTTYALDPQAGSLLGVWAAKVRHHATVVCRLGAEELEQAARLCEALTRLSAELWDTPAARPARRGRRR